MRLPRDVSAKELIKSLELLGYVVRRQRGSHVNLATDRDGEHHLSVAMHDPIKVGTLNSILKDLAEHHGLERDALLKMLFPK